MLLLQQKYINVQYLNFVSFSLQIIFFIVSGIIWKSNVGLQLCSNYRIVVGHGSGLCFKIKKQNFYSTSISNPEVFFPLFFSQIAFLAWNSNWLYFLWPKRTSRSGVIWSETYITFIIVIYVSDMIYDYDKWIVNALFRLVIRLT